MRTSIAALAAVIVMPAVAEAYPLDVEDDVYAAQDDRPQFEGGFGALVGTFSTGDVAGTAFGIHLDGGLRWKRLALLGEYDFMTFSEDTDVARPLRALIHRGGVNLRYSFGVLRKWDFPVRGDFWIEAGAGRELVTWFDGGRLHRNDASIGIGAQVAVRFGDHKRRRLGLYYALKFTIADRPESKIPPPGCAGPCDEASPMIPIDLGVFFNVGVPFSL